MRSFYHLYPNSFANKKVIHVVSLLLPPPVIGSCLSVFLNNQSKWQTNINIFSHDQILNICIGETLLDPKFRNKQKLYVVGKKKLTRQFLKTQKTIRVECPNVFCWSMAADPDMVIIILDSFFYIILHHLFFFLVFNFFPKRCGNISSFFYFKFDKVSLMCVRVILTSRCFHCQSDSWLVTMLKHLKQKR